MGLMSAPIVSNIQGELFYNYGNPFQLTSLPSLISNILGTLLLIGALIVFICLLWGGWQWMNAGDKEASLQQARERLTHCLVGFAVLALSYAIALLVQGFFGLNTFEEIPFEEAPSITPTPPPATPTPVSATTNCNTNTDCWNDPSLGTCYVCLGPGVRTCQPNPGGGCTLNCWNPGTGICTSNTPMSCEPGSGATYTCNNACTIDADCVEGGVCNPITGQCEDPVVPNIATSQNCDDICADQGGTCGSVGTNILADDGTAYLGNDASCPLAQNATCDEVMNQYDPPHSACAGRERDWTNCRCLPSAPLPIGETCTSNLECISNLCASSIDNDNDTYYTELISGTGTCQLALDCNDNNLDVHPFQTNYFEDPIPGTINDFNYDCSDSNGDGDMNDKLARFDCLNQLSDFACYAEIPAPQAVAANGWETNIPQCGDTLFGSGNWWTCGAYDSNVCGGTMWSYTYCGSPCVPGFQSWRNTWKPAFPSHTAPWNKMPCK